jgi:hypothetical protein
MPPHLLRALASLFSISLTVAAQAIEGRKCAQTAKVHPDSRIVYNATYGVLADQAGRFPVTGNYTTNLIIPSP